MIAQEPMDANRSVPMMSFATIPEVRKKFMKDESSTGSKWAGLSTKKLVSETRMARGRRHNGGADENRTRDLRRDRPAF